jgi:hypothetical protein
VVRTRRGCKKSELARNIDAGKAKHCATHDGSTTSELSYKFFFSIYVRVPQLPVSSSTIPQPSHVSSYDSILYGRTTLHHVF